MIQIFNPNKRMQPRCHAITFSVLTNRSSCDYSHSFCCCAVYHRLGGRHWLFRTFSSRGSGKSNRKRPNWSSCMPLSSLLWRHIALMLCWLAFRSLWLTLNFCQVMQKLSPQTVL